jgi:hypothetical protein
MAQPVADALLGLAEARDGFARALPAALCGG